MKSNLLLHMCRTGYLAFVLLMACWLIFQSQHNAYSFIFNLLWIIPILLPINGIIKGYPYTYAWAGFILCFYLLHGLTLLYIKSPIPLFAIIEVILVTFLIFGFSFYARNKSRELKQFNILSKNNDPKE